MTILGIYAIGFILTAILFYDERLKVYKKSEERFVDMSEKDWLVAAVVYCLLWPVAICYMMGVMIYEYIREDK